MILVWFSCAADAPEGRSLALADAPLVETPATPDTLYVAHPRELRGLWVATVANIDWPSTPGATEEEQRAELGRLMDRAAEVHLNAVFFQVRTEADAFYRSELEPWSRYLTGEQGKDPGWDPLQTAVDEAHARGLELHAWFNPYRAALVASSQRSTTHVSKAHPDAVHTYGGQLWMDPGSDWVRERAVAVVLDVATRYEVDGVHFDDYFYPYPKEGRSFPDDRTYAAYRAGGGTLERDAWRRQSVDALIRATSVALREDAPGVRFGVSPFGIYRPGQPEDVSGFDPVAGLHADPLQWLHEGWVDYLAPQLYWPTTAERQPFASLATWWGQQGTTDTSVFTGLYLSQIGSSAAWTRAEFRRQVEIARAAPGVEGQVWFSARPLLDDASGAVGLLRDELYSTPALPPAIPRLSVGQVPLPIIDASEGVLSLTPQPGVRAYTLYRLDVVLPPTLERILDGRLSRLPDPGPGLFALAAVGPGAVEGRAVMVPRGTGPTAPRALPP